MVNLFLNFSGFFLPSAQKIAIKKSFSLHFSLSFLTIDKIRKICYILFCKKQWRRHALPLRLLRERPTFGARVLCACGCDTTSEPPVGNSRSGAPVKASMSGEAIRNQGGTVEYLCIPPLIVQGVGIFYTFSQGLPSRGSCQRQLTDEV